MLTNGTAPYRHFIASEKKIGKAMHEDDKALQPKGQDR